MTAAWARAQQQVPLSAAKGALIYSAELAACDALDGIADGIISNPEACHFNPEVLLCAGSSNDSCLTAAEIQAVNTIRSDLKDATGRVIGAPYGLGIRRKQRHLPARFPRAFWQWHFVRRPTIRRRSTSIVTSRP